jgi:diguanylate cyclase
MAISPMKNNQLIPLGEAMTILKEMDRALAFHLQWLKNLHRTLICAEQIHPDDIAQGAHCRCDFGFWYQGLPESLKASEPGIAELDDPHRLMHDAARQLLQAHQSGEGIEPTLYETFMTRAIHFKQKMREYQLDLVQRVCSVDQLTGTWNRNAMTARLAEETERARRGQKALCICLLDIDHFKVVNDRLGHPAGDMVLHFVAQFLKDNLRPYDSLFRYGGEEFLICLPDTDLVQAEVLIDRVRGKLADTTIDLPDQPPIRITASFGVAALDLEDEHSMAIEHADHALLCAKARGRNRVCAWDVSTPPPGQSG